MSDVLNCKIKAAYPDTSYAGASYRRKQLSNWTPVRLPADVDLLPDLPTLVARSRDLDRNNGVAAGCFQALNDNIVGTGLRLACQPDYRALGRDIAWAKEWGRAVESLWRTWADSCACDAAYSLNFAGLTQLVLRNGLEAGEALVLPMWVARKETPFRTCLQLVDSDRLGTPLSDALAPTRNLRGGVEIDD